ncbi:DUF2071 domain-containing protein [Actinoplanes philippinensis]|uniref:DUF2071 domain-containing protein n=1 Tax=Actinoplanes philippinensis TaxID=35752 RepID=UPI0034008C2C
MRPRMASVIERRLLVNYRTDPEVTARLLPAPLRPQVVNGWAVSGICLIRLSGVRPAAVPVPFGVRSENAAHRIAVEWDTADGVAHGVYIPRRDTGSLLTTWAGGRIFPGHHSRGRFDVHETAGELQININDDTQGVRVEAHVRTTEALTGSHLFAGTDEASEFFRRGSDGFSATPDPDRLDGVRLSSREWRVTPVEPVSVRSSFFDDPVNFPHGTAILDCGLVMRDIAAQWSALPSMTVRPAAVASR